MYLQMNKQDELRMFCETKVFVGEALPYAYIMWPLRFSRLAKTKSKRKKK